MPTRYVKYAFIPELSLRCQCFPVYRRYEIRLFSVGVGAGKFLDAIAFILGAEKPWQVGFKLIPRKQGS